VRVTAHLRIVQGDETEKDVQVPGREHQEFELLHLERHTWKCRRDVLPWVGFMSGETSKSPVCGGQNIRLI